MSSRIVATRISVRTIASVATRSGPSLRLASRVPRGSSKSARVPRNWGSAMVAAAVTSGTAVGAFAAVVYAEQPADSSPQSDAPLSKEEISGVAAAIQDVLDNDEEDGLGPTLVRLAWHASGTYDKESGTGGSDGATMRFSPESEYGANAGLHVARTALEPVKKLFPRISYADLWTLAGAVAIEHMGGPKIVWRQGRKDAAGGDKCPPDSRLPDADKGKVGATIRHVRQIFNRQGFDDREMVALIGAHALGRCHTDRSGYSGPWTRAPTTFSNLYFKELLENTWTLKHWDGPDQFEDPTGDLMMLPADMALLWDRDFRKYVVEFAQDEDKFFTAFATAFQKLEENGVQAFSSSNNGSGKPWFKFW